MSKFKPLIQQLSHHFPMHPSRCETFVGMIMGLICGGNVQHNALARQVESSTQSAAVKRVERFFKEEKLSVEIYAITIVYFLNFVGQFKLRLDLMSDN